jgi:hypothetical protein
MKLIFCVSTIKMYSHKTQIKRREKNKSMTILMFSNEFIS